jgi:hypothetical protein
MVRKFFLVSLFPVGKSGQNQTPNSKVVLFLKAALVKAFELKLLIS